MKNQTVKITWFYISRQRAGQAQHHLPLYLRLHHHHPHDWREDGRGGHEPPVRISNLKLQCDH